MDAAGRKKLKDYYIDTIVFLFQLILDNIRYKIKNSKKFEKNKLNLNLQKLNEENYNLIKNVLDDLSSVFAVNNESKNSIKHKYFLIFNYEFGVALLYNFESMHNLICTYTHAVYPKKLRQADWQVKTF